MNEPKQLRLPFEPAKEQARRERVERLLSGDLRHKIKRASDLRFSYQTATAIARRAQR